MPALVEIKGVGPVLAKACAEKGFGSAADIAAAKVGDLAAVPGISEARASLLIEAAKAVLADPPAAPAAKSKKDAGKGGKKKKSKGKKQDKGSKKKQEGQEKEEVEEEKIGFCIFETEGPTGFPVLRLRIGLSQMKTLSRHRASGSTGEV